MEEHSDHFKMMIANQERYGELENPDGYGVKKGDCGDIVEIYLLVQDGQVHKVTFQIAGCLNTFACANTISYMAEGKLVTDCWQLSPEVVIAFLESLPTDHHHCAELAIGTFYQALNDYNRNLRDPWRKTYPRAKGLK